MRAFAELFDQLDSSTSTRAKVAALTGYFAQAQGADAAWAVYFLAGGKPRQTVPTGLLRSTAAQQAGIADWLFEAAYQAVGDLAETIAHILPPPQRASALGLAEWVEQRLLPLRGQPPEAQAAALRCWWDELPARERFLLVKLIGGGFRVGVSRLLVQRALATVAGLDDTLIAQRMMGYTDSRRAPTAAAYRALIDPARDAVRDAGQPYPFFLAHPLELPARAEATTPLRADAVAAGSGADGRAELGAELSAELNAELSAELSAALGDPAGWWAEWKYDGIRAQIVRRAGQVWIWSRGEELITERFPEVAVWAQPLPDGCVLDGELLVWDGDRPAPFARLQPRIARKTLSRKLLADTPVSFVAYDLLESDGQDRRAEPLHQRRERLQALRAGTLAMTDDTQPGWRVSPRAQPASPGWAGLVALRTESRVRGVEGLMLKPVGSPYGIGRSRGEGGWLKWKIDPFTLDAVLIYAQAGHGRRASLYTDYTFAVWSRTPRDADEAQAVVEAIRRREPATPGALQLLPLAKAYSGLSDDELRAVDQHIRAHTLEKFGPVRSVVPTLVFELAFEGLQRSPRHKSGVALRFPRMARIRHDKAVWQADDLGVAQRLLASA
jgi:DNA ligase-1